MTGKFTTVALILLSLTGASHGCAVCAGGDNQALIDASNSVLWTLLGLVAFIFTATGATIFFFWRKAAKAAAAEQTSILSPLTPALSKD